MFNSSEQERNLTEKQARSKGVGSISGQGNKFLRIFTYVVIFITGQDSYKGVGHTSTLDESYT